MILVSIGGQRYRLDSLEPDEVASAIGYSSDHSEEILLGIYKQFGGVEAFTAKKLSEPMKRLRDTLLYSEKFPASEHEAIFNKTENFSRWDAYTFTRRSIHIFEDFEKFMRVWAVNKDAAIDFSHLFKRDDGFWAANIWETLPTIHDERCGRDGQNDHYWCKTPRVFHADRNLEYEKKSKLRLEATVDPKIITFIQDQVLTGTEDMRKAYAQSLFIRDDHWEKLAADPKRSVLNSLVDNALLPLELAEQIVFKHKTPAIRESIAKMTTSNDLLRVIWAGTKSESIRKAVEANTLFTGVE